jgi:hypothetical protein
MRRAAWCVGVAVVGAAAGSVLGSSSGGAGAIVLDHNSLWRQFQVMRPSYVRLADGKLEPREITWYWGGIRSKAAEAGDSSPLPPADWTSATFDDGLWSRVRLPQPTLTVSGANPRPFYAPYAVGVVVLRGKFEVKDPKQVQSCRVSLSYWGGAAVYVNGQEVARAHLPPEKTLDAVAEDYPLDVFLTPEGRPFRVDDVRYKDRVTLRQRGLSNVQVPADLLRQGTNVVAVEVHQAPVPEVIAKGVGQEISGCGWPPIGVLRAEVTVSPAGAALSAPANGVQVWNAAAYDTVTAFDYADRCEAFKPVVIRAARNGLFSGRLLVGSDQAVRNLKVSVSDLSQPAGTATLPNSAVQVRYATPATPAKSWVPTYRFDGLLDAIPAEVPVYAEKPRAERFFDYAVDRAELRGRAVASLWFTLRVPKDAKPGAYQGTVSVSADGLAATTVPLQVTVSDWTVPDPKDSRVTNFAYLSEDAVARHYDVPLWSDEHLALIAKSLALMAETNSRQVFVNLAIDFYGQDGNRESVVRWVRQPDGSYTHDFTVLDRYLDMVAKTIGKPFPLRLNCWGETDKDGQSTTAAMVSLLDPATGKVQPMPQPTLGTEESYRFWKPVLDEVLKRVQARGWLDVTSLGHNSYCWAVKPPVVDVAKRLWPEGVWTYTAHNGSLGGAFAGTSKSITMPIRYADTVWSAGHLTARGYSALLKPRPGYWCFTYRGCFRDDSPLTDLRRIDEDEIMMGHDGLSDFGADLFPIKRPNGAIYGIANGRGTGGPGNSTMALLAPGPKGAIATERFEMFREGAELAEALLFIQRAIEGKKISDDLIQRANKYLDQRGEGFLKGWFGVRYMQAEHDEQLLNLAGEVARALK